MRGMIAIIRAMLGSGATRSHRVLRRYDRALQQYRDQQMRSEKASAR